jgi:methionyl-tRNA formyltransferase
MSLRLAFMGTPDFSVTCLRAVAGAGYDVVVAYTQPPRKAGRGKKVQKSPVHTFAEQEKIPVLHPEKLGSTAEQMQFAAYNPDVAIVVAYGLILPSPILSAPRHGCLNLHASLLPRWRGAAPIQRAIMAGDRKTGAMIMRMDEGLDTGPVCKTATCDITPDMTAGTLHDVLAETGANLMLEALADIKKGEVECLPQSSAKVTYAHKIKKSEARINWSDTSESVHNKVRGLSPFPGAWLEAISGSGQRERIKVLQTAVLRKNGIPGEILDDRLAVACGSGSVRLLRLQRAGRKPMDAEDLLRGFTISGIVV